MIIVCALLFGVIAAGFITLMVNEMGKSSENNLSQSAYDSAIVGVEDTKTLIKKYNEIMDYYNSGGGDYTAGGKYTNGDDIKTAIESATLGKCLNFGSLNDTNIPLDKETPNGTAVFVKETTAADITTVQAYTCISLDFHPKDYLATLSSENPIRLIPLQAVGGNNSINSVRISWYSADNLARQDAKYYNYVDGAIQFSNEASNPPVLVASIYQASSNFTLSQFSNTNGSTTNRGILWLIPSKDPTMPFGGTDQDRTTIINENALLNSNNHDAGKTHTGYPVRCAKKDGSGDETTNLDYLCSVQIDLPNPIGSRSNERGTFLLALALPYSQPTTDIRVEMSKGTGTSAWDTSSKSYVAESFDGVQTVIDSTGRANDVYQRVESRVEFFDSDFPFPDYALTLDGGDDNVLLKDFVTTSEAYNGCWHSYVIDGDSEIKDKCE